MNTNREQDGEDFQTCNFRELRESEIGFAVTAYEDMLKELVHLEETQILPTKRTIDSVNYLLRVNYRNGILSYVMTVNKIIVGHFMFSSDRIMFDTKENTVYVLGIYIDKEYRSLSNFNKFIKYVESELTNNGIKAVNMSLVNRKSSHGIIKKNNLKLLSIAVYKKL